MYNTLTYMLYMQSIRNIYIYIYLFIYLYMCGINSIRRPSGACWMVAGGIPAAFLWRFPLPSQPSPPPRAPPKDFSKTESFGVFFLGPFWGPNALGPGPQGAHPWNLQAWRLEASWLPSAFRHTLTAFRKNLTAALQNALTVQGTGYRG